MNSKLTSIELDAFAWKATGEWSTASAHKADDSIGDYNHLVRWFLWDKVGRAIRITSGAPTASAFELKLMEASGSPPDTCPIESGFFGAPLRDKISGLISSFRKKPEQRAAQVSDFHRRPGSLLYIPVLSDRLMNATGELVRRNFCQVVAQYTHRTMDGVTLFHPTLLPNPDYDKAENIFNAIIAGLKEFAIALLPGDAALLRSQLINLTSQLNSVQAKLEILQPDAIVVHGDNHPPFQSYVLAARKMGIPSIMLQHGLDCEHNYLDEAYASHIAVWGAERLGRYEEKSVWQPRMSVTGNPEYDQLRIPEKIRCGGDYWLWATRPHSPEKCYAPSRTPREGVDIFYAIAEALDKKPETRLVIKAHPYDYCDPIEEIIAAQELQGRVRLSTQSLGDLLPHASLVVTEDSTAGLDALLAGKPLVHAHFAQCRPTLPFVEYGAALPGFTREQLVESLLKASSLGQEEADNFLPGQSAFIKDFAGPCDGGAGGRFAAFIEEILCQK